MLEEFIMIWCATTCHVPDRNATVSIATEAITNTSFGFITELYCILQNSFTKVYFLQCLEGPTRGFGLVRVVNQQAAQTVLRRTDHFETLNYSPLIHSLHASEWFQINYN